MIDRHRDRDRDKDRDKGKKLVPGHWHNFFLFPFVCSHSCAKTIVPHYCVCFHALSFLCSLPSPNKRTLDDDVVLSTR